ncbi:MAG TPA: hypothetical protein VFO56_05515, partial [Gaiellaceae bacterium]|nr:hypothetical protein [Gaiellaceae bacterium]
MSDPSCDRRVVVVDVLEHLQRANDVEVLLGFEVLEPTVEQLASGANPTRRDVERVLVRLDADIL